MAATKASRKVKDGKPTARESPVEDSPGGFELNAFYERLLEMREQNLSAFNTMSNATRLAVEAYIKAKLNFAKPRADKAAA